MTNLKYFGLNLSNNNPEKSENIKYLVNCAK